MPDLDPDDLARIAKAVADIWGDAVARQLTTVAARMGRGIEEPGWAEAKLLDLVSLRSDAQAVIAELQQSGPIAVQRAIEEAYEAGIDGAANAIRLDAPLRPATNSSAVQALARETIQRVQGVNTSILRIADDVYRTVTAEVAAPGVVTGTMTRRQAAQAALNRYAEVGVTAFRDRDGKNWELESYVEMTTRTSSGRAMIDGRTETYQADGRNFVIVSDSPEECKLCRPFEGKGLSLNGEGVGTKVGGIPIIATLAQARSEGLHHPNCRHDLRPIIPGLTRPFASTSDPAGDTIRTEQRRLERKKRALRRVEAVQLTPEDARRIRAKIAAVDAELRAIVEDRGAYAAKMADAAEARKPGSKVAQQWRSAADDIAAGKSQRRGKRLRYRERVGGAR